MQKQRAWIAWAGLTAWAGVLVGMSYGTAINLPYRSDDFFHIPCVNASSLVEIWQTACGYYFRPVPFTIWKVLYILLGRHDLIVQHSLNLGLHLVNGLLVAWLADRLWADSDQVDWRRRYLSATLFLIFPLSYEAVPWIGALVHPLVTILILISIAAYLKMRLTGHRRWGALSLGAAFVAPFAHENGVLIAPLLAAIELTRWQDAEPLVKRGLRVAVWLIPTGLWWLIWRRVPSANGGEHIALNAITNILRNGIYVAQGSGYPLTQWGGWLRDTFGVNEFGAAVLLSGIALACAAVVQWRSGADRRSALSWLWITIAAAPVILFLDYWYVSAAPRMLMLASVGSAWLWTDVIVRLVSWRSRGGRRIGLGLAAGVSALIVISSYTFIHAQMRLFQIGGAATRQMIDDTVAANTMGRPAFFLNLPVWVAAPHPTYALGNEGVIFLTFFDRLDSAVSLHTAQPAQVQGFRVDAIRQSVPYYAGVYGQNPPSWSELAHTGGQVFATVYTTDTVQVLPVGVLSETLPLTPGLANFDRAVSLRDAAATRAEDGWRVDLLWRVNQPLPPDVTVFVHVLDANGQLIAQADGDPLANTYAFAQWPPGSVVRDIRVIGVNHPAAVQVGLYHRATGERLLAASESGAPYPDQAVPVPIKE